jgi:DNA-binding NarL/FixJ family response regulator
MNADGGDAATIVVADAHPVVRGAIRLSCGAVPGLRVVDEVQSAPALIAACEKHRPDVAVLDLAFPEGLETIRELNERDLVGAVVVLTERTDGPTVLEALRLGVQAYLVKASALQTVGQQIRRVVAGERVISPEVERVAVAELGRFTELAREGTQVRASLTPREHEILVMISRGFTMRQIATRLGISPRTVETHVGKLYRKLGVRTRVQAVSRSVSLGLIELR